MGLPCFWDARSGFVCARCGLVVQSCAKLGAVRQVRRCGRLRLVAFAFLLYSQYCVCGPALGKGVNVQA